MVSWRDVRLLVPSPLRAMPADLVAVVLFVGATAASVFLPVVDGTYVRVGFGLALVLFVPGYAFVAALFPEASDRQSTDASDSEDSLVGHAGIDGFERVALSFGTSIALVPLVGLVLNISPWGIRVGPAMVSLSALTLGFVAVATVRRRRLPPTDRFAVPYRRYVRIARSELLDPDSRRDRWLNVALAVCVVLAVASVGYVVAFPKQGEAFTELYLLAETDDGELVADDYPTTFEAGESRSLTVGIDNHEHRSIDYTVVVALQRATVENGSLRVIETRELDRFETRLSAGDALERPVDVRPTTTGDRQRLVFLLYRGDPRRPLAVDTAYRATSLWIDVTS